MTPLPSPPRGAVVGLLARCLGRESDADISALSSALFMGVRVDREGIPLTDYHTIGADGGYITATRAVREATIETHRDYLCDARFTVALTGPGEMLEGLPQSLAPACRRALPRTTLLRADRTPGWQPHRSQRSGGCAAASPCRHARTRAATDAPTGCHRGAGGPRRHRGRRFGPSRCPALSARWEHADRMVRETWIDLVV